MSDISILVENIRGALNASELVSAEAIEAMQKYANLYAEACTDLNGRIQRCIPYIRNGNFTEAVRLAEIKPPISEVFALLDFSERDAWVDTCQLLSFPVPPLLLYDLAQELNASYTKHSSIESLLKQHRLLALNDSPLAERIAVLRAIAKADASNIFWAEDVENYERARIAELDNDVKSAIAAKDDDKLDTLQDELTSPEWTIPPPKHIIRSILAITLERYTTKLMTAYNEFDVERANAVYDAIQTLLNSNGLSMSTAKLQQIAPAVTWLDIENAKTENEAEYQQCLYTMREALDSHDMRPYLESCYYALSRAATQSGNNIPPDIAEYFRETIATYEWSRSRNMLLAILGTLCATLLVAVVVVFVIRNQLHERSVMAHETHLQQLADEQRFEEMQAAIDNIGAAIASHPKVMAGVEQLKTLLAQDKKREEDFVRYLEQAQSSLETDKFDRAALAQVKILARTKAEQRQYSVLQSEFDQKIADKKTDTSNQFSKSLNQIRDEFSIVRSDTNRTPNALLLELDALLIRTSSLAVTDIQSAYVAQQATLITDIQTARDGLTKSIAQDTAVRNFQKDIGDWTRYKNALSAFVSTHMGHPDLHNFQTVLADFDAISSVYSKVNVLTASYNRNATDIASFHKNVASYAVQIKTLEGLLADPKQDLPHLFPAQPLLDMFSKTVPFDPNTAFSQMKAIVKSLIQKQVYPMVIRNDKWVYFTKDPYFEMAPGVFPNRLYITALSNSKEEMCPFIAADWDPAKKLNGSQYTFARETTTVLDSMFSNASVATRFSQQTIRKILETDGIDPILKIVLLDAILTDTVKFDPFYAAHMQQLLTIIKGCGVNDSINWMDCSLDASSSTSNTVIDKRALAQETLSRLATLGMSSSIQKCEALKDTFPELLLQNRSSFHWVGILDRDKDGKTYVMRPSVATSVTGELYLLKRDATQKVRLVPIGTMSALNNAANTTGMPVLAIAKSW